MTVPSSYPASKCVERTNRTHMTTPILGSSSSSSEPTAGVPHATFPFDARITTIVPRASPANAMRSSQSLATRQNPCTRVYTARSTISVASPSSPSPRRQNFNDPSFPCVTRIARDDVDASPVVLIATSRMASTPDAGACACRRPTARRVVVSHVTMTPSASPVSSARAPRRASNDAHCASVACARKTTGSGGGLVGME